MLKTLLNELRDLHSNHQKSYGRKRSKVIKEQAEYACAFARENSILIEPEYSFENLVTPDKNYEQSINAVIKGSEHIVELDSDSSTIIKITIPEGFGLTPKLIQVIQAHSNLRDEIKSYRPSIEFLTGTPLEYLSRWQVCNDLFNDNVDLCNVILWPNGRVSFSISQPLYAGNIPSNTEINTYFSQAGWTQINNTLHHSIFYNYAFGALAMDIEPRNCYVSDDGNLLPFDIILSEPDDELSEFLKLY